MDIKVKDSGEIDVSPRWRKKNNEMRAYFINYMEMGDGLRQKINELAIITHEENPDWTLNRIANFIYLANEDLDGFSMRNVTRNVTNENRIILDVKKPKRVRALPNQLLEELRQQKGTQVTPSEEEVEELQNNVIEEKSDTCPTLVPEESSSRTIDSSSSSSTGMNDAVDSVYDLEDEGDEGEGEEPQIIYDDPAKLIRQYEQQIKDLLNENKKLLEENQKLWQLKRENEELKRENEELKRQLNNKKQQRGQ